jgi:hypothetical protein
VTKIPEIVKSGLPEGTAPGGSAAEVVDAALDKFDMSAIVQPIVDGLSEMNDKDSEFVIRECLKTVQRHVPSTSGAASWSNVWNRQADQLQYQDIDLMIVLQLVFKVLMNFAAPFSSVLASKTRP